MSRYIDADELEDFIFRWGGGATSEDCIEWIRNTETADVVEVVRCKDCIYWCKLKEDNGVVVRIHHNELRSQCLNINGLNKTDCITEANDYCSYGERAKE